MLQGKCYQYLFYVIFTIIIQITHYFGSQCIQQASLHCNEAKAGSFQLNSVQNMFSITVFLQTDNNTTGYCYSLSKHLKYNFKIK